MKCLAEHLESTEGNGSHDNGFSKDHPKGLPPASLCSKHVDRKGMKRPWSFVDRSID